MLRERIKRAKEQARKACQALKIRATEEELDTIDRALAELQVEREAIKELRARASVLKDVRGSAGGRRTAELREESDQEVVRNIGDEPVLLCVFERIKGKIKQSAHRSRTEAFFEYLHDHPEAVDEEIARQQLKWEREAEEMIGRLARPPRGDLKELEGYLGEVDEADRLLIRQPVATSDVPF